MKSAKLIFDKSIRELNDIQTIYDHLQSEYRLADEISDLLRLQLVNLLSAMDRFLHEIIRIGLGESFSGTRTITEKAKSFQVSLGTVVSMNLIASFPAPQNTQLYWVNNEIIVRLKHLSFQQSKNVSDGLSLVWSEPHKFQYLAKAMGCPGTTDNQKAEYLRQTLDLLVERRNQIVHEADYDVSIQCKRPITKNIVSDAIQFVSSFVQVVYIAVTSNI